MRAETELRKHRCCFTGHRPEKLSRNSYFIKRELKKEIKRTIASGYIVYISGMARGTDIWAAELILKLKKKHPNLKLICAIPYPGFEQKWPSKTQVQYHNILKNADIVKVIAPSYSPDVFRYRNEWMVNHSNKIIAVFGGKTGGTMNTIDYAFKNHITVKIIRG